MILPTSHDLRAKLTPKIRGTEYVHRLEHLKSTLDTLATGYGDFRTSVASGRCRATEISVFAYGWMEEVFGLCCVLAFVIQP